MNGLETTQTPSVPLLPFAAETGAIQKADAAFRTISEVSVELDVPQHVLRFWETKFAQIRPVKRNGGRRYYRPQDIELIRRIKTLLYKQGYTIRGVQRVLRRPSEASEGMQEEAVQPQVHSPALGAAEVIPTSTDQSVATETAPPAVEKAPPVPGSRLFANAMSRMQPLAHVTALPGVYPQIGSGTVPVPGPAILPPKPAALREAAEKAAAASLAPPLVTTTPPLARNAHATTIATAKPQKIDPAARQRLEQLLAGLHQLRDDLAAIRQ